MGVEAAMRGLSIKTRLIFVFAVLAATQVAIAAFGLHGLGLADREITEVYQQRFLPVSGLARISDLMHDSIEQLTIAVIARPSPRNVQKYLDRVEQNLNQVEARVQDYRRQAEGAEAQKALADWNTKRSNLIDKGIKPALAALKEQSFDDAEDLILGVSAKQFPAVEQDFNAIVASELQNADRTHVAADDRYQLTRTLSIAAGAFALGLCALMALYITGSVSAPLTAMAAAMRRLIDGDLGVQVSAGTRQDEIGTMVHALQAFKDSLVDAARLRAEQVTESERAAAEKRAALGDMAGRIEAETGSAMQHIGDRTAKMTVTADEMRGLAERVSVSAQGAAGAAASALDTAQAVAGAAEQLAASIREISGQVSQSTAMVGHAVEAGNETRATIETLNERVGQIGAVADIIRDIASRTNLLALNATIEAARAGEAGKGFAVVASEVKQLADQTARSTAEITRHIGEVRVATAAAVSAVTRIEATISEVNAIAGSISASVDMQGKATADIARNVTETAAAVNEMSSRNTEVSQEAERAGRYAEEVLDNTKVLDGAVDELRRGLIRTVRTSTAEVDRRLFQRHATDLPCQIDLPGLGRIAARIVDISEGGARVTGLPAISVGMRGTLQTSGMATPVAFIVRDVSDTAAGLAFETDDPVQQTLRAGLQRLPLRSAA
jgi:methyl-accepting chemotaxis protein